MQLRDELLLGLGVDGRHIFGEVVLEAAEGVGDLERVSHRSNGM